ncbi:MAG: flagellar biosynthesis anti-sigma factor FlgM [Gemmatimonadota bacterium]|jgi:anti-sigma28 factor (negative regulator of flagellin synthesis)|nr:flagellar biosynthesis anti-sigma factor FlgM [Gemmatimonadota bacterium]
MKMNGPKDPIIPAGGVREAAQAPARSRGQVEEQPPRNAARDSVSISAEARQLAEHASESTLSPERTAEIRRKILDGAYNSAEMAGEVAKRILASGDV